MLSHAVRHPGYLFWVALAYLPFLGEMSVPLTGDQKVYLSTAMEMWERGEWLRPFLFGDPRYIKPPLQYWAMLAGWKVFGFGLLGALLPSVLCVLGTAWLVGEISVLLGQRRPFVGSGLWFAGALATVTYGTTAQMEVFVAFFYALSWWQGLRFLAKPPGARDWRWLFGAFAVTGAAALVKSPLYSVFWVAGYLIYLVISGEWELFRERRLYAAWALGVAVGCVWFVAVAVSDGERFWAEYGVRESWNKLSGNSSTVAGFWVALLYFCFPFTFFALPALKGFRKNRHTAAVARFAIAWALPPALFFTLYPYRVRAYLYILLPLVAVLADWAYYRSGRGRVFVWLARATGALVAATLCGAGFILWRAEVVTAWPALGLACTGLACAGLAAVGRMRGFALGALAGVLFFRAAAVQMGRVDLEGLRAEWERRGRPPVAMLDEGRNVWHEVGLLSAGLGQPIRRVSTIEECAGALKAGSLVVLSDEQASAHLDRVRLELGGALEVAPWVRWKGRLRFPYRELIRGGRAAVPDFEERVKRTFRVLGQSR